MTMYPLLIIFSLALFTVITWHNLTLGLAILFSLLPTYLIRFHLGSFPTTFLEMLVWIVSIIWLIQKINILGWRGIIIEKINYIKEWPLLAFSIGLFLLGATINVFLAVDIRAALGEWRAFYVEPIIISYILVTTVKTKREINQILLGLILCGLVTSALAVYQHFTGWLVPHSFWANRNTYRVTGWYGFPNGVGLFLAPLIPLAIHLLISTYKQNKKIIASLASTYVLVSGFAIIFAKSTGAIIGLLGGLGLYFLLNKKTRIVTVVVAIIGIIGIIFIPNSNPIKQEILAQDYSGKLRRNIWSETITYLKLHPLRGAGMASYEEEIVPFRYNKKIEVFHHPHNIFLTIWVDTGLIGLLGFIGIIIWFFIHGFKIYSENETMLPGVFLISMVIWLTTGLVDSPYIKNDWALFFWLIIALNYTGDWKDLKKGT